ncbi:hypothetical protein ACTA71_003664 [Dictyostelium dimigraforme]
MEQYFKKGIFRVWIGEIFTVIISDPFIEKEMIKTIIEKPKNIKRDLFLLNLKSNLINFVFNESTINLIQSMNCNLKNNKEFKPKLFCSLFSFSIIFKLLFNIDLKNENYKEIKKIMKLVNEINKNKEKSNTIDLKLIIDFIEKQYYYHLSNMENQSLNDFMDIMIKKENKFEKKENLKKQVIYKCTDYILNKSENISKVIEKFFIFIVQNQDYQDLAFSELKSVINRKLLYNNVEENIIKLSDKSFSPITNSICKEVLRLNPVDQLSSPIVCKKDTLVNGYFIPKDSQIIINHKSMNLNEKCFDDPFKFNPKRFLNFNQSFNFNYCNFSNDEIFVAISNILLNFKIIGIKNNFTFNLFDDNYPSSVIIEKR